jgi:chromosome segregation ATPase
MAGMARLGVDYEQVKQAAIKLLSQGFAPSVQKIREVLGTGSNTTIAEHLKVWREEYAQKKIHHLPSNMPKELISAFEVLWQVAIEQAQNQLAEYKQTVESECEAALQKERDADKYVTDIKQKMAELTIALEHESVSKQKCNIDLAVTTERLIKQEEAFIAQKDQYEERLKRVYDEKDRLESHNQKLHHQITALQDSFSLKEQSHQDSLGQQNKLHEQSENRWLKLIDQARQEAKDSAKRFETLNNNCDVKIKKLSAVITNLNQDNTEKDSQLHTYQERISQLKQEIKLIETEYLKARNVITSYESDIKKDCSQRKINRSINNL